MRYSFILIILLSVVVKAQKAQLIPQKGHGVEITCLAQDPRFTSVFSADRYGNIKQWSIAEKKLIKNIPCDLRSIDKIKAFGGAGEYFLIVWSARDQKIQIIDYVNLKLLHETEYPDTLLDVTMNYYTKAKSYNKYGKVLQLHSTVGRKWLLTQSWEEVETIPYPTSAHFMYIDEYAENLISYENKMLVHYKNTEYGSYKLRTKILPQEDSIHNVLFIKQKNGIKEAIIASGDKAFYYIPAYGKVQVFPREINKEAKAFSDIFYDGENHFIKHHQLAMNYEKGILLMGEVMVDLKTFNYHYLAWPVPQINDAFFGYSNYKEMNKLIGYNGKDLIHYTLGEYSDFENNTYIASPSTLKLELYKDKLYFKSERRLFHSFDLNTLRFDDHLDLASICLSFSIDDSTDQVCVSLSDSTSSENKVNALRYDLNSGKLLGALIYDRNTFVQKVYFNNGKYFSLVNEQGENHVYMMTPNSKGYIKEIIELQQKVEPKDIILKGEYLYVLGTEQIICYSTISLKKLNKLKITDYQHPNPDSKGNLYFLQNNQLRSWNVNSKKLENLRKIYGTITGAGMLNESRFGIWTDGLEGKLLVFSNMQLIDSFVYNESQIIDAVYDEKRNNYILACTDGSIVFWDGAKRHSLLYKESWNTISSYLLYNQEGEYISSANASDLAYFNFENEIFPLSHYDLFYNQPQKLLRSMKSDDLSYTSLLTKVIEKRNRKYNLSEDVFDAKKRPELFDLNDSTLHFTTNDTAFFLIQVNSPQSKISSIEAYVNSVPILNWGKEELLEHFKDQVFIKDVRSTLASSFFDLSMSLRNIGSPQSDSNTLNRFRLDLPIFLEHGTYTEEGYNTIEIYCTNEHGIRSKVKTYEVRQDSDRTKEFPDLYVMALSVGDYKDDNYDLKFARKDGRDILNTFSANRISEYEKVFSEEDENGFLDYEDYKTYGNVFIDSLFDEEVTKENLAKVSTFFEKARPQDRIILFVSGHGVLDDSLNFWFASHDMVFKQPAENGIDFKALEQCMINSPSRHRVMLMDACHSGEVDKDVNITISEGSLAAGSRGTRVIDTEEDEQLHNSFEFLKENFADLSRSSGIYVISAAAGNSYAYESEDWQNGVFTYAIREALTSQKSFYTIDKREIDLDRNGIINDYELQALPYSTLHDLNDNFPADINQDNYISALELQRYVSKRVEELTNGMQKPTSRKGNTEYDFQLW